MMFPTGYDELFVFENRKNGFQNAVFPFVRLLVESKAAKSYFERYSTIKVERFEKDTVPYVRLISTNGHVLAKWEYEICEQRYDMPAGLYDVVVRSRSRIVLAKIRDNRAYDLLSAWPRWKNITDGIHESTFIENVIHSATFEIDLLRSFPETTLLDMEYVAMVKRVPMNFEVHWKDRSSCLHIKKYDEYTKDDIHICLMPKNMDVYEPAFTGKKGGF